MHHVVLINLELVNGAMHFHRKPMIGDECLVMLNGLLKFFQILVISMH